MSDEEPHPEWSPALEEVIKKEGEQAESLYWLHNKASEWTQRRNDFIHIPATILATLTGFFSATDNMIPAIALGSFSVLVGILNTINSYYKFSQRSEGHRISSLWYLKTYKNIETQLAIPIKQRQPAEALLKELRADMERVSETSPPIPDAVIRLYKEQFKSSLAAKPIIANGLDPISIYRAPDRPPTSVATPRPEVRVRVEI